MRELNGNFETYPMLSIFRERCSENTSLSKIIFYELTNYGSGRINSSTSSLGVELFTSPWGNNYPGEKPKMQLPLKVTHNYGLEKLWGTFRADMMADP